MRQRKFISHLHRIQGQLRGTEKMMKSQVEAEKIFQQLEAARASLTVLQRKVVENFLHDLAKPKKMAKKRLNRALHYLLK